MGGSASLGNVVISQAAPGGDDRIVSEGDFQHRGGEVVVTGDLTLGEGLRARYAMTGGSLDVSGNLRLRSVTRGDLAVPHHTDQSLFEIDGTAASEISVGAAVTLEGPNDVGTRGTLSYVLDETGVTPIHVGGGAVLGDGRLQLAADGRMTPRGTRTLTLIDGVCDGEFPVVETPHGEDLLVARTWSRHLGGNVFFEAVRYPGPTVDLDVLAAATGDANGDGQFGFSDIFLVLSAGTYRSELPAQWPQGDWNGDGRFDFNDIFIALGAGLYESGPYTAAAIPEPSGPVLVSCVLVALVVLRPPRIG
jgi:hypothetical protein